MGLTKGTEIYVEKYAPLKDPLELIIKGYHISLRVEEAANITVDGLMIDDCRFVESLLPAIASRTQCSSSFCWLAQARRAGRSVFLL